MKEEIPIWKEAPFIRFLIPLIIGICLQYSYPASFITLLSGFFISLLVLVIYNFLPLHKKYKLYFLTGAGTLLLFFFLGASMMHINDIRLNKKWFRSLSYSHKALLLVTLEETPVEKAKTFKAIAKVHQILEDGKTQAGKGKLILYIKKDSLSVKLNYGSRLLIKNKLQEIKNFPNSNGFDYRRYCALQDIYDQCYLNKDGYSLLNRERIPMIDSCLLALRKQVLSVLRRYIKGPKELGLAEALLIGYKNDLDKTVLQAYSNTGVVHVIAISGLHVGLIYSILYTLSYPLRLKAAGRLIQLLFLLTGLWTFSLLAGGSPSVLRSAVMFSFIALGNNSHRRSTIYNSLAASCFLLLCYHPLWIWDLGFQLSYTAVLSLALFVKPIYHTIYLQNKCLDYCWKMASVTLAAQVLTTPICLFYFHQFPNTFLITNMVAVPVSSIILTGEILLCIFSFSPPLAIYIGKLLEWMIFRLNDFILHMEQLPFAITRGIHISIYQVFVIYLIIILFIKWRALHSNAG